MSSDARDDSGHRWSGWPGAYCMYCGSEDIREICLAESDHELECKICIPPKCLVPDTQKDLLDDHFSGKDVGDRVNYAPKP